MAYVGRSPRYGFLEGQTATFDGSTTTVTLQRNVSSTDAIDVYIDNVHQEPDVAYTLSSGGNSITFTGTPENGAVLYIRFHGISFDTTRAYRLENSDGGSTATLGDDDSFTLSLDGTTALSATSSGVTIANLTVTGTTTTINSTDLNIGDNKIVLNADLPSDTGPTQDAGIVINRGSGPDKSFIWSESFDQFGSASDIYTTGKFHVRGSGSDPTYGGNTLAAFRNSGTNDSAYISIIGNSAQYSGIYFGDENTESAGYLRLNHTSDVLETTQPLHTSNSYIKVGDAVANGYETALGHNALTFNRSGASYIDQAQSSGSLAIRFGSTYVTPVSFNTDGTTFNKDVNIAEYIKHDGDTDTLLRFQTNRATLSAGSGASIDLHSNGQIYSNGNLVNYGQITLSASAPVMILSDSDATTDTNMTPYISFQRAGAGEKGWVGFGSSTNNRFTIDSNVGDIDLTPQGNVDITNGNLQMGGNTVLYSNGDINGFGHIQTGTVSTDSAVIKNHHIRSSFESGTVIHPFWQNDWANFRKRGGTVTWGGLTGTPSNDNTDLMFTTSTYCSVYGGDYSGSTMTITLTTPPKNFTYGSWAGITFNNESWSPSSCKIETSTDGGSTWTTRLNATNASVQYLTSFSSGSTQTNAIRFTLGLPSQNGVTGSLRIQNIFAFGYNSAGMEQYFLPRGGGQVYGNVSINTSTTSTEPLYVAKDDGSGGIVVHNDGNDAYLKLSTSRNNKSWYISHDGNNNSGTDNSLSFVEDGLYHRLTLAPGGYIGIGDPSPEARLHVNHDDTWGLLLERTGGTPHMQFRNSGDGGNYSFIWSEYGSGFKWGQRLADGSNETVYLQSNGDGQLSTNDYFTVSHNHSTVLSNTYTGAPSYTAEGGDFLRLHNSANPAAGPQYAGIWFQTPQWTGTSGTGRPVRIGGKSVERNYSADFFVQTRGTNAQIRTRMTVGEEGVMRDYTGNTSSNYKWWTPTADHYQVREYDFGNRLYIKKDVSASGYANVVWLNRYLPAEFDMTFELKGGQPSSTYRHFGIVLNGNGVANVSQWDYIVLRQHSSNSNLNTIRWDDAGVTRNNVEGSSNPNFFDGNKRRVRIEKRASSLRCEVASLGQSPYVWGTHTGLGFTATEGGFTGFSIYEPGASDTWVEIGNLTITEV